MMCCRNGNILTDKQDRWCTDGVPVKYKFDGRGADPPTHPEFNGRRNVYLVPIIVLYVGTFG